MNDPLRSLSQLAVDAPHLATASEAIQKLSPSGRALLLKALGEAVHGGESRPVDVLTNEAGEAVMFVGRPDLTPERNARVVEAMIRLLETYRTRTALAEALAMSLPACSSIINGQNGASYATAAKVAGLIGVSVHELLGARVVES